MIAHRATVVETAAIWLRSETYAYAWAVLPTLVYLLWHNRNRLTALAPEASMAGVAAAALGAALWIAGDLMNISIVRQFALVASLCAIVLAAVGWSVFRALMPFLAMLFFLVPAGDILLGPLKHIAMGFIQVFAWLTDLPFRQDGLALFVGTQRYVIVDYCAGLGFVLIGMFIGLSLALLIYRSLPKIVTLTLLGGAVGILANGLRIIGIVAYDYLTGSELTLEQHAYFELPILFLAFGALLLVFSRLRPEAAPDNGESGRGIAAVSPKRRIVMVALAALPVALAPFLWQARALPQPAPMAASIPGSVMDWTRQGAVSDWRPQAAASSVDSFVATFARHPEQASVFVAQATTRRAKVSGSSINLVGGQGWMPADQETMTACADTGCVDVRRSKYLLRDSERVRHVYAVQVSGDSIIASPLAFRMHRAWSTVVGARGAARFVAVATESPRGLPAADIAAFVQAFAAD